MTFTIDNEGNLNTDTRTICALVGLISVIRLMGIFGNFTGGDDLISQLMNLYCLKGVG